jgi:hypothetical protein
VMGTPHGCASHVPQDGHAGSSQMATSALGSATLLGTPQRVSFIINIASIYGTLWFPHQLM